MVDATTRFFETSTGGRYEPCWRSPAEASASDLHEGARTTHWLMRSTGESIEVSREDREADTVIGTSPALFENLAAGREDGVAALLRGDITVTRGPPVGAAVGAALPQPSGCLRPARPNRSVQAEREVH